MSYSKIKSITKHHSDIPIPVYDISVKKNHNFAVDGGLIVHNCLPYQFLKNVIYEKRIEMYDSVLLTEEIIGLERNNNSGKVDHSPSGINCFTGDTKIQLVDGRSVPIKNLIEEFNLGRQNYVYSFNHITQKIEPQLITNAWCSGKDARLLKVTLDNNEVIKCTPEHKFMFRDGTYKMAKDLHPNESLMPLYLKYPSKGGLTGYRLYYEPMEDTWHYEHRRFAQEVLDERYLVHHKDCNPHNNNPSNLVWCSKGLHTKIHAQMQTGALSPEAQKKRSESLKESYREAKLNADYYLRWHPDKTIEKIKFLHDNLEKDKLRREIIRKERHENHQKKILERDAKRQRMCEYFGVNYEDLTEHEARSLSIKYARIEDPTYQQRVSEALSKNHKLGKYTNAYAALQQCNDERKNNGRPKHIVEKVLATKAKHVPYEISQETRKKIGLATSKKRWFNNGDVNIYIDPEIHEVPEGFAHGRIKTWKNHKVKSVEYILEREDVYDLTIQNTHNFALSAGIFVHNSKDTSDAVCGALWNASKHVEEFNFEFGETLDTIVDVSSVATNQNIKQQVILDFEDELKRARAAIPDKQRDYFMDFGMGKRGDLNADLYLMDGIIL